MKSLLARALTGAALILPASAALAADPKSEGAAQRVLEYGSKVDPKRPPTHSPPACRSCARPP